MNKPTIRSPIPLFIVVLLAACADDLGSPSVQEGAFESEETVLTDQALIDAEVSVADGVSRDIWTTGVGGVDVHYVLDQIGLQSLISEVRLRLRPEPGAELRLRFRKPSGVWGSWSEWTTGPSERRIAVPAPGGEVLDDYQIELRESAAAAPTIASSGYIRVKKLNTGG